MKRELVDHLACPQCAGTLGLSGVDRKGDEIETGLLVCQKAHVYKIIKGVPRMVVEDGDEAQKATADSFSRKWEAVPDYGYTAGTMKLHRKWYLDRYGWKTEARLRKYLKACNRVLDAGMGVGRDVAWYAGLADTPVFGVDLGTSVDSAYRHVGKLPNVHIIQADITRLPFRADYFDFVVSDFVLHHTPNAEGSLARLLEHVKPAGEIAGYVYRKKGDAREFADDLIRATTTQMTNDDCWRFSEACAEFGRAVSEVDLCLQRDIYWGLFKCFWNPEFTLAENISVNFDWYHPKYAHRHTPEEVWGWLAGLNVASIHTDVQESGISFRGVRR